MHSRLMSYRNPRFRLIALLCAARGSQFGTSHGTGGALQIAPTSSTRKAATSLSTWPVFDGGEQQSGVTSAGTILTSSNSNNSTHLWEQTLPATLGGAPVELPTVTPSAGNKTLFFVTTEAGSLRALGAAAGRQAWYQDTTGPNITTSSPAIDPCGLFVYSYRLDGKVHPYAAGSGAATMSGDRPATMTLLPEVGKGSFPLNINTRYLSMTISGYNGDRGHSVGHSVAVDLSVGATTVFNALCPTIHHLLDDNPGDKNYCPDRQVDTRARGGVVIDPATGNVCTTTGNGPYNPGTGGDDCGESILELGADLATLIDSSTPSSYATLQAKDEELDSKAPAILPKQAKRKTPYLALHAGKDNTLRPVNRQHLSDQEGPNHVGDGLQVVNLPQGWGVNPHPTAWDDPTNTSWVLVANNCGLSAFKVIPGSRGQRRLRFVYQYNHTGSSPFIADTVLSVQGCGPPGALTPSTGALPWSSTQPSTGGSIGNLHWQSPTVVDDSGYIYDYALRG